MTSNETAQGAYKTGEYAITKQDLTRASLSIGALGMEFSWTYANQMGLAFGMMVKKMLKKIYHDDPQGYAAALERHTAFFNITVCLAPFVGGIAMSMEERIAKGELPPESVNDIKAALMGPLSGIGDAIFLTTIRVVAAGIAISLASQGNVLGPILFLLIFNIPHWTIRYILTQKSYELGHRILDAMTENGIIEKISLCAGILGMMVIGAMTSSMISISTPLVFNMANGVTLELQTVLDEILPNLLPLVTMLVVAWLLRKNVKVVPLIFGILAFGIVFNLLGIIV